MAFHLSATETEQLYLKWRREEEAFTRLDRLLNDRILTPKTNTELSDLNGSNLLKLTMCIETMSVQINLWEAVGGSLDYLWLKPWLSLWSWEIN